MPNGGHDDVAHRLMYITCAGLRCHLPPWTRRAQRVHGVQRNYSQSLTATEMVHGLKHTIARLPLKFVVVALLAGASVRTDKK